MDRVPCVNGKFYSTNSDVLVSEIERYKAKITANASAALGAVLPHAGYAYSGAVAVETLQHILPAEKIILLGPNHTGMGEPFAVWPDGVWKTPIGDVAVDTAIVEEIISAGNVIKEDSIAHLHEHSIEVQLPILKYLYKDFTIVPICCAVRSSELCSQAADQIFQGIKKLKSRVLLILSTDFTHYEPEMSVRKKDLQLLEKIVALDEDGLVDVLSAQNGSMCGIAPAMVFLKCLKLMGARKASVIKYSTSGEVSGDLSSVVGYAGLVLR